MRLSEVQRGPEGYHRMSPPQGPCVSITVWPDWRTSRRRALWQSSRTRDRQGGVRTTAWLSSGSGCLSFLVLAVYRCMRRRLAMAAAPVIMALTRKSPSAGSLPLPKERLIKEDWPHARPWSQMWRCHRTEECFFSSYLSDLGRSRCSNEAFFHTPQAHQHSQTRWGRRFCPGF